MDDGIDAASLDAYLGLHYVPGPATILKSIRRVLPGERLVVPIDAPRPRRVRYYRPSLSDVVPVSDGDLAEAVVDAVESRLIADVPVGVFLSGGLDSSIVAAVAARKQERIATFSMGFHSTDHDESAHAAAVAVAIGSDHHCFRFDENTFQSLLPQVASALDEPIGDQALLPLYWLCREARRHVTVVLSGEGADEVFAGYGYYRGNAQCVNWQRLFDNPDPVTPSGFPLLTNRQQRHRLLPMERGGGSEWEAELVDWLNGTPDPLRCATAADLASWLPDDLLVKYDRMAMAHSLEGRAPFLSPRVVEAGLGLRPDGETRRGGLQGGTEEDRRALAPPRDPGPPQAGVRPADEGVVTAVVSQRRVRAGLLQGPRSARAGPGGARSPGRGGLERRRPSRAAPLRARPPRRMVHFIPGDGG